MASVTLAESAKLALNDLVAGVIENVITVNKMYELVPFDGISGNALAYNRENALGNVVAAEVGDAIASDGVNPIDSSTDGTAPATFSQVTSSLTTIIGDAYVNGLIQATRSDINDQVAVQVASKAKHCGRVWQHMLINGSGTAPQFTGLINLCASGQKVDTGTNGSALSFAILDELIDLVVDKDGEVDYLCMPARTLRTYFSLLRGLGGASIGDTVELPSGAKVPAYRGIPIFRNDYIPTNVTKGSSSNTTYVFGGTFDDGSRQHGIAGLTSEKDAGIQIVPVGESETKDESITRIKWYCGLALFSEKGLAMADGITD